MQQHCTVAMLFGGQSAEHEVSIQSAQNVHAALEAAGYDIIRIGVDRQGTWRLAPSVGLLDPSWPPVAMLPGGSGEIVVLDGK